MTTPTAAHVDEAIESLAAGVPATPAEQAHLAACADCRARLELAARLEQILAEWPVTRPAPGFTTRVTVAARRETWREEQVVDWGFNIAIAAGVVSVVAGLVGMGWLLGSAASPADASRFVIDASVEVLSRLRGQALVVGTGSLLLTTGLGAWWWAEERWRW